MTDQAQNARPQATPKVAAGALFVDERDRLMLVRPTYKSHWDIPGGYVEEGESPLSACAREVYEELGLRVTIGPLLTIDWAPRPDEGDKVLFIFDGGTLSTDQLSAVSFRDGEIAEWAFVEDGQLDELTIPRLARRLRASMQARKQGFAYLEEGADPAKL
ncbi:NUDIX domain-containing protein [Micromonospora sp. ZYX-F-536]|uniref:NUDIX domain-containing protein n=1 Tax=Micromonospora sp. ZYX-F-536 TaxID=3457629 RepID=UPI004040B06D